MSTVLKTSNQSEGSDVSMVDAGLSRPDPEVPEKKKTRYFTAQYKLRIISETDTCKSPGEIGAILRREGLYHSSLKTWRRQREQGVLGGLTPKKRGRKPVETNPLASEVARLEKENRRLKERLKQAETIIEFQKKIAEMLGIPAEQTS